MFPALGCQLSSVAGFDIAVRKTHVAACFTTDDLPNLQRPRHLKDSDDHEF